MAYITLRVKYVNLGDTESGKSWLVSFRLFRLFVYLLFFSVKSIRFSYISTQFIVIRYNRAVKAVRRPRAMTPRRMVSTTTKE